jgi:MFS family permease
MLNNNDDPFDRAFRMTPAASRMALQILALCFFLSAFGRGIGDSFTVFLLPVSSTFGWDRAQVVSIYSLASVAGALASPFVGKLLDRFGPRVTYSLGLLLIALACLAASRAQALWQFQASLGVCVGVGAASIGLVPNSILLARWFSKGLPTATAVVYSAMGGGVLLLLPLSQFAIDRLGWRDAYLAYGVATLGLLGIVSLLPWRRIAAGSPDIPRASDKADTDDGWTLARAVRHHAFWALYSTYFFTAIGMYAVSAQVVAYLIDVGFSPIEAATAWGFSGIVLVVGMMSISWLDRIIGRRSSILISYALSIGGIVLLWLLRSYPNIWLLAGFILTFGSMVGSRGPLITATAMKIYRGQRVGTIFGTLTIGIGLGAAIGSWSGGLIHDLTGHYEAVFAFSLLNTIFGMAPFLFVRALRE